MVVKLSRLSGCGVLIVYSRAVQCSVLRSVRSNHDYACDDSDDIENRKLKHIVHSLPLTLLSLTQRQYKFHVI